MHELYLAAGVFTAVEDESRNTMVDSMLLGVGLPGMVGVDVCEVCAGRLQCMAEAGSGSAGYRRQLPDHRPGLFVR